MGDLINCHGRHTVTPTLYNHITDIIGDKNYGPRRIYTNI